jgi:hypothetical protein
VDLEIVFPLKQMASNYIQEIIMDTLPDNILQIINDNIHGDRNHFKLQFDDVIEEIKKQLYFCEIQSNAESCNICNFTDKTFRNNTTSYSQAYEEYSSCYKGMASTDCKCVVKDFKIINLWFRFLKEEFDESSDESSDETMMMNYLQQTGNNVIS